MKHDKQHLDQFFEAARNEAPLMTDAEFSDLVQNVPKSSVPETFSHTPIRRLLTAVTQPGGLIMTGLGLTAITGLIVTGYLLNSPESTLQPAPPQPNVASYADVRTTTEDKVAASITPAAPERRVPQPAQESIPKTVSAISAPDTSWWSRVQVTAPAPVDATDADLVQLGVQLDPDGRVRLRHKAGNGKVSIMMAFPPLPRSIDRATDLKAERAPEAPVMPTIVTDGNGKKLAFFFHLDTAGRGFQGHAVSMAQINGDEEALDGLPPSLPFPEFEMEDQTIKIGSGEEGLELNISSSKAPGEASKVVIKQSSIDTTMANPPHRMKLITRKKHRSLPADSLMPPVREQIVMFHIDSVSDLRHKRLFDSLHRDVAHHKIFADSLAKWAMKIHKEFSSEIFIDEPGQIPPPPHHFRKMFDMDIEAQMERINSLIPIRIRVADPNATYNKNGLIFWYQPTEEFLSQASDVLREHARAVAESQPSADKSSVASVTPTIQQALVYPNPAVGTAQYSFELAESRAVSVAIYDLLGKQVKVVCTNSILPAGTSQVNLDLHSIPEVVYLVVLVTDRGEQLSTRLVVGQ